MKPVLWLMVLFVLMVAGAVANAKTSGPNYYSAEEVALARERVATEDWAQAHVASLKSRVAYVLEMSDEELWRFIPPAELTRATFVWRGQGGHPGCPICGKKIFEVGGGFYPWTYALQHPWKVQCPAGETWFPPNDFESYYNNDMQGECDMSGDYPDDGSGWMNEKNGVLHYFVGYWCQHQRWADLLNAIRDLGEIYLLTQDETYARAAALLLCRLATVYPAMDYPAQSNYGAYGRVLPWCWENTSVVKPVAIAYDSVWPYMNSTNDEGLTGFLAAKGITDLCAHVDRGFLQDVAEKMMTTEAYTSNEGDHQRAFAIVALVWGDNDASHGITTDDMLDWILNGRGQMNATIWNGIYPDGHPNEASPGYSSAVATKSWEIADLVSRAGLDLFSNPRFPAAAHVWLDLTICGQQQPALGDYGNIFGGDKAGWSAQMFRLAWERFGDPRFAKALVAIGNPRASLYETDIRDEIAEAAAAYEKPLVGGTRNLSQFGLAILEGGTEEDPRGLALYSGSAAGGHGHLDRLNIELVAHDQSIMPDLGYPDQWGPKTQQFHKNSPAHYGVHIDEHGQMNRERGKLHFIADLEDVQIVEASAERTYPDLADTYRRTTALVDLSPTDFYVCDIFRVKGGSKHDWLFHGPPQDEFSVEGMKLSEPREQGTLAGEDVELGEMPPDSNGSGYHWLHSVQAAKPAGEWSALYVQKSPKPALKMTMLPGCAQEVFVTQFDSPQIKSRDLPDSLPWIVARNETDGTSRFVSVIRTVRGEDCIEKIEPLQVAPGAGEAVALRVTTAEYVDTIYSSMDGTEAAAIGENLKVTGRFVLVRRNRSGELVSVHALGCDEVTGPDFAMRGDGRMEGTLTACDPDARTITVSGLDCTEALVGESVLFGNERMQTNFQVEAVAPVAGGGVTLGLGHVSPMFGHGLVHAVDDDTRTILTDTTFRNYGSEDIWALGFDPKVEGMYLLNGARSRHFRIQECELFPDNIDKGWWKPAKEYGSFQLGGEGKLSDTFKAGDEWYLQALWPGDWARMENAVVLKAHKPRAWKLMTTTGSVQVKLPGMGDTVVFKAVGGKGGASELRATEGLISLDSAVLQGGRGYIVTDPAAGVDYGEADAPRLVRMEADGKRVEYEPGMNLGDLKAEKLTLVIEDRNPLEPLRLSFSGHLLQPGSGGITVSARGTSRTAVTIELAKLLSTAAVPEMDYPPMLRIEARDRALNDQACVIRLMFGDVAAPAAQAVFLSDINAVSSACHSGLKLDQKYSEESAITFRGRHFDKSLMTCPRKDGPGEVIYDLQPYPAQRIFRAVVGVDDETGTRGTVTFEVYVDKGDGKWQKLHETMRLTGGGSVKLLSVDLGPEAKRLRLMTTDAGDGHGSDHAVWANARLEAKQ